MPQILHGRTGQGIARQNKQAILPAHHVQMPAGLVVHGHPTQGTTQVRGRLDLARVQRDHDHLSGGEHLGELVSDNQWRVNHALAEVQAPGQITVTGIQAN